MRKLTEDLPVHLNILGLPSSEKKILLLALLNQMGNHNNSWKPKNICIFLPDDKAAKTLYNFIQDQSEIILTKESLANVKIGYLPDKSVWGLDRYSDKILIDFHRTQTISHIALELSPNIIVGSTSAFLQNTLPKETIDREFLTLKKDEEYDFQLLGQKFKDLGYLSVDILREPGQYCIKGGIIDLFSSYFSKPVRLEFFGDTLLSLALFSVEHQITEKPIEYCPVVSVREMVLTEKEKTQKLQNLYEILIDKDIDSKYRTEIIKDLKENIRTPYDDIIAPLIRDSAQCSLDLLSDNDLIIFWEPITTLEERHKTYIHKLTQHFSLESNDNKISTHPKNHFSQINIDKILSFKKSMEFQNPIPTKIQTVMSKPLSIIGSEISAIQSLEKSEKFHAWVHYIKESQKTLTNTFLIPCISINHLERISSLLEARGLKVEISNQHFIRLINTNKFAEPKTVVCLGDFDSYIFDPDNNLFILPENILLDQDKNSIKKSKTTKKVTSVDAFSDLKPGSLLIHTNHGVGKFISAQNIEVSGHKAEFIIIEYGGGDKLYLPVDKLNLIQRYNFKLDGYEKVKLDKLKSKSWSTKKSKAKKAIEDMAEDLLKVQAKRKLSRITPIYSPPESFFEVESEFPYEETGDQLDSLEDIYSDFSMAYPMDRILCGDVGFGKTEVALRASAKIALDGRQVLILVPTTVLCLQHYYTFFKRLNHHGINVSYLNRTVSLKDSKKILQDLKSGLLDILIGTHRILSKDINPNKLGLIIVDEEQRFGVKQKEILKQLKSSTHILTMTATPLPRTMHMSSLGLKDISLIAEPPANRLAVKTHICPFDKEIITMAIQREIERGGQIFYLCNKVSFLDKIAADLNELLPGKAKAKVAHGQMAPRELETTMMEFMEAKFNILVCTTIMESGIDIPNANTLIVQDSQNYGLTQLYQIRGRIGRSNRQSYAYFILPDLTDIAGDTVKRLEILRANEKLGSGFAVAQYDLEMRGTGNLLGPEQSGHISEIGFELYQTMLSQALHKLRNNFEEPLLPEPEIKLNVEALLPKSYISSDRERLTIYKKLFASEHFDEIDLMERQLRNRFGKLPLSAQNIISVATIKCALKKCRAASIKYVPSKNLVEIAYNALAENQLGVLINYLQDQQTSYITDDFKVHLVKIPKRDKEQLNYLLKFLQPLAQDFDFLSQK